MSNSEIDKLLCEQLLLLSEQSKAYKNDPKELCLIIETTIKLTQSIIAIH